MSRFVKSDMHMLRSRRLAGCRRNILFFIMMKMMEKLAKSPMTMIRASTANATNQVQSASIARLQGLIDSYFLQVTCCQCLPAWHHSSCSMAYRPGKLCQKISNKPCDRAIDVLCRILANLRRPDLTNLTPRLRLSTRLSWAPGTLSHFPPPTVRHSCNLRIRLCPPDLAGIWGERIRRLSKGHRPIGRSVHVQNIFKQQETWKEMKLRAQEIAGAIETSNFPSTTSSSTTGISAILHFKYTRFLNFSLTPTLYVAHLTQLT